jgi:hypothetical protein
MCSFMKQIINFTNCALNGEDTYYQVYNYLSPECRGIYLITWYEHLGSASSAHRRIR